MHDTAYVPARRVLSRIKRVDFVAVVGPTAVGKTTLIKAAVLASPNLHMLVAGVSREPRLGEQDGIDFHFASKPTMEARAHTGEYVTVVRGVAGDLYATAPEDYPANKTILMAVLADAIPMFRALPYRHFRTIFIVPPDHETWRARLAQHNFDPEQFRRRMQEAERSLAFGLEDQATCFVINQSLTIATEDVVTLALGKPLPPRLQADQPRARKVLANLLKQLRRQPNLRNR